jgi:hypothetical protein
MLEPLSGRGAPPLRRRVRSFKDLVSAALETRGPKRIAYSECCGYHVDKDAPGAAAFVKRAL